ncbi:MAG: glycosyltransferase [Mycobacteriales bacterium]
MTGVPRPPFEHLSRLSDDTGLFEHARGSLPRRECGYCVDDVARGLVVLARQPRPDAELVRLAERYLTFLAKAQAPDGAFHNRLDRHGRWEDQPGIGDWWGRALWGLGTFAARGQPEGLRQDALARFELAAVHRPPWPRSLAFAALGAAEVLSARPDHPAALDLVAAAAKVIGPAGPRNGDWPWPEPRLHYANAVLPEVLLIAGQRLGQPGTTADGLALLGWLLAVETRRGRLSVTPAGGWQPPEPRPGFDQQPIEVAALADACARAYELTGDRWWLSGVRMCVAWFRGDNDSATPLHDTATGGSGDGLTPHGVSDNQGAESTLALISTFQQGQRMPRTQ